MGKFEILLLEERGPRKWICLLRSSKRLRAGERIAVRSLKSSDHVGLATIVSPVEEGRAEVELADDLSLETYGQPPLPPYIERTPDVADWERYQTIYARESGSVAAPTAGLHFTEDLMAKLRARGVELAPITLHVGLGTFLPVRTENVAEHRLDSERYRISADTAARIAKARREMRPILAVGTTVVRALEESGGEAGEGRAALFIVPGYTFSCGDRSDDKLSSAALNATSSDLCIRWARGVVCRLQPSDR